MHLEAVMIIVDNCESSRNGDYAPTRYEAQSDAVNIIFRSVSDGNQESSVGLISSGGKGPEVLTTLTRNHGKIIDGLHRTKNKISGSTHIWTALQVAFLGLKHRENRAQRQRIVAFVCSPPEAQEQRKLDDLALKLRKNNVTTDFVLFGDTHDDETRKTFEYFTGKVRGDKPESASMVVIPPSSKLLSDQLLGTGVFFGERGGGLREGADGMGAGGSEYGEFDFDPNLEPELALALRMSAEEERARQEKARREQEEEQRKLGTLEDIKEEGEPLLDEDGKPKEDKKDDGGNDDDKMDTS